VRGWFAITTGALVLANGARLRRRLHGLDRTAPSTEAVTTSHAFLVAAGVLLSGEARRAASAHARREGLDVLDLVPADLPPERLLDLARTVHVARYRADRFAAGQGAGQAVLVDRAVLARASVDEREDYAAVELLKIVRRLKQYAPATTGLAIAPGLKAAGCGGADRVRMRAAGYRHPYQAVAYLPAIRTAAVAVACVTTPGWGLLTLALTASQPAAVAAGRVSPGSRNVLATSARRLASWPAFAVEAAQTRRAGATAPDLDARRRRTEYQAEISTETAKHFEQRRDRCPWCGSTALLARTSAADVILRKPGRFTYDQCDACAHIFLNPCLSPAGLDFYYRDFYDGLNADQAEGMFAASDFGYRSRAKLLPVNAGATHWLDVGGGHGHFCLVAGGLLPDVRFDAVDQGDGIAEAARRGWVRHAYRRMFPDLGSEIAGRYDVISMFHYLEHTLEPCRELDAAAAALPPAGHLLIEVPHAHGPSFALFRGFWVGLCPPQHLHLISPDELVKALAERGLRTVKVEFGPAHIFGDATSAVYYLTQKLQPNPTLPWLPYEATAWRRARRIGALAATAPLFLLAALADAVMLPYLLTGRRANVYRVVARKEG
jgi:2-polyprenyl-3-methyl-5-hydroxy-6-metoxy-1,4-benzoquinol methylase